ncbi:hypothetical protein PMAYCL1PPCAC_22134, partial [Pristionchus mayeri]
MCVSLLIFGFILTKVATNAEINAHSKLGSALFEHYNMGLSPYMGVGVNWTAEFEEEPRKEQGLRADINILDIYLLSVVESEGMVNVLVRADVAWNDHRLVWSPSSHGGTKWVEVRGDQIWLPSIRATRSGTPLPILTEATRGKLMHTGRIQTIFWSYFSFRYPMSYKDFPRDSHTCFVCFEHEYGHLVDHTTTLESVNLWGAEEWTIQNRFNITRWSNEICYAIHITRRTVFWDTLVLL